MGNQGPGSHIQKVTIRIAWCERYKADPRIDFHERMFILTISQIGCPGSIAASRLFIANIQKVIAGERLRPSIGQVIKLFGSSPCSRDGKCSSSRIQSKRVARSK